MFIAITDKKEGRLLPAILFAVLCLLTAIAGYARFYALQFGAGQQDDEIGRAVVSKVLKTHEADTNWARTDVTERFRYDSYNFSSYYLFAAGVEMLDRRTDADGRIRLLIAHLRQTSALLGALCVLFAGVLAWRLGGKLAALTAAVMTGSSVMLFTDSLYARPETFVTLLSLLFLLLLTSRRMSRWLVLMLAGLLVGVLIACKVTFLIYLPFPLLLAPVFGSAVGGERKEDPQHMRWMGAVAAYFLALGAGFYIGAPYALKYPWEFLSGLGGLIRQYRETVFGTSQRMLGSFLENATSLDYTIGSLGLVMAAIGIFALVRRKRLDSLVTVLGPLVTLVYFFGGSAIYERNFSQALPVVFVLAGLGIEYLVSLIKRPGRLRLLIAAALLICTAAVPLSVLAKLIHPALDGSYQQQVDARTTALGRDGRTMVFFVLGNADKYNGPFCGAYVYMEKYFDDASLRLPEFLPPGYREVGRVESVFGGQSISTLQIYYAPSYLYLAPPRSSDCKLELAPLEAVPREATIPARVTMTGDAIRAGAHATAPASWPWPLYGTWSGADAHTGTIQIGPFHACGDVIIPVSGGRAPVKSSLEIRRRSAVGESVLFNGMPPVQPYAWEQIRLHQASHECGTFTVSARDEGVDWEDWVGLGQPAAIPEAH